MPHWLTIALGVLVFMLDFQQVCVQAELSHRRSLPRLYGNSSRNSLGVALLISAILSTVLYLSFILFD